MAQVSRLPLSEKIYQRIFEIFFQTAAEIRTKKAAEEFFNDLLTPTERIMLAKRLSIAVLLAKGYDYRSIREILHVSPPTIATASQAFKYTGQGYKKLIAKLLREEAIEKILLDIGEGFAKMGSFGQGKGTATWRDVRRMIQNKRKQKQF